MNDIYVSISEELDHGEKWYQVQQQRYEDDLQDLPPSVLGYGFVGHCAQGVTIGNSASLQSLSWRQ